MSLHAEQGASVASGFGAAKIIPIRFGVQKSFDKQWAKENEWPVSGYWEGSVYSMKGQRGQAPDSHNRLEAVAVAGVFRFQRVTKTILGWPYIDIGLGLSWLSRKEIGGRKLGMHFQFEDRIGIGVRWGEKRQYDIGYRAVHFSNAYIGSYNNGINLHLLVLGYWFH
jgi:lipid A 3-O-deacylase